MKQGIRSFVVLILAISCGPRRLKCGPKRCELNLLKHEKNTTLTCVTTVS